MNDMALELSSMESYNPVTREWQPLANMAARRAYMGVGVIDDHIYAVGGWNGHEGMLDTVEKYSIEKVR
jgi:hypothetical protein